ncbi:MAG: hypothetical protein ABI398_00620 [Devosia sp.]
MLVESFVFARSVQRTPAAFRRHLAGSIGLWARGQRQFRAWTPHINKTLAVLDTTIDDIASRRTVAVLGSGPLFDVPIESLARTFKRVLLIDLSHLSTTDRRLRPYANVERVWRDLAPPGDASPLAFLSDIADLDWVISVNLLSQIGEAAADGNERQTIDNHLAGLTALPMPVTLVTDVDYRVFDRAGTLIEDVDLMHGYALPAPESRWLWEVAPFGEEAPDARRIHTVFAYPDWHNLPRLSF